MKKIIFASLVALGASAAVLVESTQPCRKLRIIPMTMPTPSTMTIVQRCRMLDSPVWGYRSEIRSPSICQRRKIRQLPARFIVRLAVPVKNPRIRQVIVVKTILATRRRDEIIISWFVYRAQGKRAACRYFQMRMLIFGSQTGGISFRQKVSHIPLC